MWNLLSEEWKDILPLGFEKTPEMLALSNFLNARHSKPIYPKTGDLFRAFNLTSPEQTNVIIIGQDPYHGPDQANGLCFSVPNGVKPPPSLKNIFKEIKNDIGQERVDTDLSDWARQGVLMINTSLTVFEGEPGSHMNYWLPFTKMVLESLVQSKKSKNHLVFLLWGAFAQRQAAFVQKPHVTIMSAHPSPLSACRGFFGSKPFSRINSHLINPIKWA